ncbi:hypothetical protein JCM14720_19470 [Calditerricola yamamurae]
MQTGIGPIDNFVRLVLGIFVAALVVMMSGRMLRMLHRHEYAQLAATLLLFLVAFWFIYNPDSILNIFDRITDSASSKIGGGGGGAGTGQ